MRSKFAMLLAIVAVCATTAWASWTAESLITADPAKDHQFGGRTMVFASDGVGHAVWWRTVNGAGIYCHRYNAGSGWTPDYQVNPIGLGARIALDADGTTIHLVYGASTLCYQKCVRQGDGSDQWGPVVSLYGAHPTDYQIAASVPGDPGHVVVSWTESGQISRKVGYNSIGFIECISGVWGSPIRLDSTVSYSRYSPSIAVAPNGDVFIAYCSGDDPSGRKVYVKTRHNGVWGATVDVTPGLGSDQCTRPAIEVSPHTGNPHVAFCWQRTIQISRKVSDISYRVGHTYRNAQGSWQVPESISVPRHFQGLYTSYFDPAMAFVSDGAAYVAWRENSPTTSSGIMYGSCSAEGGTWSIPAWLSPDTSGTNVDACPSVAVDEAAGAVRVAWKRSLYSGEARQIWWRSNPLGSGGGQAQPTAISQSGIELFPNPAKAGRVTVQYSLPRAEPARVTLLDVSGRAVSTQIVAATGSKGSFALDAFGLKPGVYILKLDTGTGNLTRKLVIE